MLDRAPRLGIPRRPGRVRWRGVVRLGILGAAVAFDVGLAARPAAATPTPAASPAALENLPGATERSVTRLLRRIRRRYGDQAVVIQGQLLMRAIESGAQRGTAVRVAGFERHGDTRFLEFALESGLVFDDRSRDRRARILVLWGTILEPTLATVREPLPGDGALAVVTEVHHRPGGIGGGDAGAGESPGTLETIAFYLDGAALLELRTGRVTAHDLVHRARIEVDGTPWTQPLPATGWPTGPGPDQF